MTENNLCKTKSQKKHWEMPLQKLNKNYCKVPKQNHGKTNKEYAEDMQKEEGLLNEQNLLSVTKVICWQSLTKISSSYS